MDSQRLPWKSLVVLWFLVGLMAWSAVGFAGTAVDNRIYADLLARYNHAGVVDYAGFKKEEARLDAYLEHLAQVDPDQLDRNDQFAFYVNAYNAWTIKLILTGYPGVQSIKDLGGWIQGPWKKKFVRIRDRTLTLDDIEHKILRPRFKDPRVHFAVNCASKSCPPLAAAPYAGARLNQQLDEAARNFINDARFNRLEGERLYVSRIFKWFGGDFHDDVIGFFRRYANGDLQQALDRGGRSIRVEYLEYDWSLNGR